MIKYFIILILISVTCNAALSISVQQVYQPPNLNINWYQATEMPGDWGYKFNGEINKPGLAMKVTFEYSDGSSAYTDSGIDPLYFRGMYFTGGSYVDVTIKSRDFYPAYNKFVVGKYKVFFTPCELKNGECGETFFTNRVITVKAAVPLNLPGVKDIVVTQSDDLKTVTLTWDYTWEPYSYPDGEHNEYIWASWGRLDMFYKSNPEWGGYCQSTVTNFQKQYVCSVENSWAWAMGPFYFGFNFKYRHISDYNTIHTSPLYTTKTFSLICSNGKFGADCDVEPDPCDSAPCQNGGTCTIEGSGFKCDCPPGTGGDTCDIGVGCDLSPCKNGGNCVADTTNKANFACNCVGGYTGRLCDVTPKICNSDTTCKNWGYCHQDPADDNAFTCVCPQGFAGTTCNEQPPACTYSPCQNGGVCTDGSTPSAYTCSCKNGWTGTNCLTPPPKYCEANPNPCKNNGACTAHSSDPYNNYVCSCSEGWDGSTCEVPMPYCSYKMTNPCQNGGTCGDHPTDIRNNYICTCTDGYSGVNCETHTAKYCDNNSPCQNGGICVNHETDATKYTCDCHQDYEGVNCEIEKPAACDASPCQNGGECQQNPNNKQLYSCTCVDGFFGKNCDKDPCANPNNPCKNNGVCSRESQEWKGQTLKFTCDCSDTDYHGVICHVKKPSSPCAANPCQNGGVCTEEEFMFKDVKLFYKCDCSDTNFSGVNCQTAHNPCATNPCKNGGVCKKYGQTVDGNYYSFTCECPTGFEGIICQKVKLIKGCDSNPCQNGGECVPHPNNPKFYSCNCVDNFFGPNCQKDPCANPTNPCKNSGVCSRESQDWKGQKLKFTCDCSATGGYSGVICQVSPANNPCNTNPCKNGGICKAESFLFGETTLPYTCDCKGTGFSGVICQSSYAPCANNPCKNGGVCSVTGQTFDKQFYPFTCTCPETHEGIICQKIKKDHCSPNPCKHNGVCTEESQEWNGQTLPFTCTCNSDWKGVVCQKSNNLCKTYEPAKTLCQKNAGTCITDPDRENWYGCECKKHFGGPTCHDLSYLVYKASFFSTIAGHFDETTNNMKPLGQMTPITDFPNLTVKNIRETMQQYILLLKKREGIQKTWSYQKQKVFSFWVLSWLNNPNQTLKTINNPNIMVSVADAYSNGYGKNL
jgi:hypothetical protein